MNGENIDFNPKLMRNCYSIIFSYPNKISTISQDNLLSIYTPKIFYINSCLS